MKSLLRFRMIKSVAAYELRVVLRNRWVVAYAVVLALLTLSISYFGLAVIEYTGFQEFNRTAVSLLNLLLYVVPLATMLMAAQSFRAEGGATDQLFAEPISVAEIVLGKMAGLSVAHGLATILGFSITGVLIGAKVGSQGIFGYLILLGFTVLLGMVFLALATLLTILTQRGVRTYAVVLITWFGLVLIFDLVIIGLSFVLPEFWANRLALAGVILNPVDGTRVATLMLIAGREMFGAAGAQLVRNLGGVSQSAALMTAALVFWLIWPIAVSITLLKRQDI